VPDTDTAFVGGAGGSWRFQTARLFLDYTRNIDPNASGITVQRDQLRLRLTKDYSERFAVLAAVRYIADNGPGAAFNDRKYGAATIGAEYRMRRAWSVVGRYDHSWLDEDLAPRSASSNAFRLSMVYKPSRGVEESGESFLDR
jgi:predicted porin